LSVMDAASHRQTGARVELAANAIRCCRLCPRDCGVDRTAGEVGFCGLTDSLRCYREVLYDGEEADLNPSHHIYFAGCNLRCEFCTVGEWNERPEAAGETNIDDLQASISERQRQGARTLNLLGGEPAVSVYGILGLLSRIKPETTVVWNSNMYYNAIVDELIEGLVDVYLADLKVGSERCAAAILKAADYLEIVRRNIVKASERGRVIVRHVILPGHTECCLKPILHWLAEELPTVELSLRGDYFPPANANSAPRGYLSRNEFQNALQLAEQFRLNLLK
jgi:putative pyruvate formate lyase activating enzyme